MAAPVPPSLQPRPPFTPPPELQLFPKCHLHSARPLPGGPEARPQATQSAPNACFTQGIASQLGNKFQLPIPANPTGPSPTTNLNTPTATPPSSAIPSPSQPQPQHQHQQQHQQQQQQRQQQQPPCSSTCHAPPNVPQLPFPPGTDPQYVAMATRIAGYYQQRSQAWAAAHRKQCQAAMQAATVVVAWYVRDRLARRRKRKRRKFARALEAREREKEREKERERRRVAAGGVGAAGGCAAWESVRRWVCRLPAPSLAPSLPLVGVGIPGGPFASAAAAAAAVAANGSGADAARDMPWDRDEANFDMDRTRARDKDAQLYDVADNIIKNHLTRTDVPLLGALSFDESESESEEEESEDGSMDYDEEEDAEGEDDEYGGNGCQVAPPQGGMASGSKEAQLGTPNGGR